MTTETRTASGFVRNGTTATQALGPPPDYLSNGDRLTQKEFHALYERLPENVHAELIGGFVYMASPLRIRHGSNHSWATAAFVYYTGHTSGVQVCDNTTVVLGGDSEPQPDLFLRVRPEYGGRSGTTDGDYVDGPPELILEVSDSTRALDLNVKRSEYARYGVLEYLVLNLHDRSLHWFDLSIDRELFADSDGVVRAHSFPGLWIDIEAVLKEDIRRIHATLDQGLATPEHAAFVAKLAAAKKS